MTTFSEDVLLGLAAERPASALGPVPAAPNPSQTLIVRGAEIVFNVFAVAGHSQSLFVKWRVK